MRLFQAILQSIFSCFLVMLLVALFVLYPREIQYVGRGAGVERVYQFSWSEYGENLRLFFTRLVHEGNLGQTIFDQPVEVEWMHYMSRSLLLIGIAFLLSVPMGIAKGIIDYRHAHRKTNVLGNGTTAFFQSVPDFMVIICVQWGLVELMEIGFPRFSVYIADKWYSFILPSILLSLFPTVYLARITSSALAGQEKKLYVLFARSKGLSERMVLYRHMLRNCWPTVLSHLPSIMTVILSNLLIVEYLTTYKGAAYRLYEAVGYNDSAARNVFYAGMQPVFEANLILAILFSFMFLILITQIISAIARNRLDPLWREEK
jgi:oligopeptide transport system permease protein